MLEVKPSDEISDDQYLLQHKYRRSIGVINAFMKSITHSESQKVCIITSQLGSREKFGGGKTPRDTYGKSKCYLNDKYRKIEPVWRENG